MDPWVIWLVAAALFAAGEVATTGFFLAPFAIGAGAATIVDLAGAPLPFSVIAFVLVSLAALTLVRPLARKHMAMPAISRTGTAALVGKSATVLEAIGHDEGKVRLDGEVWTARAYDEDQTFTEGQRVQVIEIRGATALVTDH